MKNKLVTTKFLITICLAEVLAYMAVDMYLPSMQGIAKYFNSSYSKVQLSLTFYLFSLGIGQLLCGPIVDYYGRKKPFIIGIIIYILCSLGIVFSKNIETFLLFRVIQGLGVAFMYVCVLTMIRDLTKEKETARILAILITIGSITPVLAPALGGYIEYKYGWEAVFYCLFLSGCFILILSLFIINETLEYKNKIKINFINVFKIYIELIKDKEFLKPTIAACLLYMFVFAYIAGASYVYQDIFNLTSKNFGYILGATASSLVFGALISTKLIKIISQKSLSIAGANLVLIGSIICFSSSFFENFCFEGIIFGFFISFFGLGLSDAILFSIAMSSQEKSIGATASLLGSLELLLPGFATLICGYLIEISLLHWLSSILILGILCTLSTYFVFQKRQ